MVCYLHTNSSSKPRKQTGRKRGAKVSARANRKNFKKRMMITETMPTIMEYKEIDLFSKRFVCGWCELFL
jgi:hypothetical protein